MKRKWQSWISRNQGGRGCFDASWRLRNKI